MARECAVHRMQGIVYLRKVELDRNFEGLRTYPNQVQVRSSFTWYFEIHSQLVAMQNIANI